MCGSERCINDDRGSENGGGFSEHGSISADPRLRAVAAL